MTLNQPWTHVQSIRHSNLNNLVNDVMGVGNRRPRIYKIPTVYWPITFSYLRKFSTTKSEIV